MKRLLNPFGFRAFHCAAFTAAALLLVYGGLLWFSDDGLVFLGLCCTATARPGRVVTQTIEAVNLVSATRSVEVVPTCGCTDVGVSALRVPGYSVVPLTVAYRVAGPPRSVITRTVVIVYHAQRRWKRVTAQIAIRMSSDRNGVPTADQTAPART